MPEVRKSLRKIRAELDVTQKEFAKMLDIPLSTYVRKENGESQFTLEEAYKVSKLVNKPVDELFFNQ